MKASASSVLSVVVCACWVLGMPLQPAQAASGTEGTQQSSSSSSSSSSSTILQALHCPPCERIHCPARHTLQLSCSGGITTGVCGCCPACAKVEGESCGGRWDYLGKCDDGLVCVHESPAAAGAGAGPGADAENKGICKKALSVDSCRPECTWDYCQANPQEICSARWVSLGRQECQGSCQHTSCSSCLVLRPPHCPQSCGPADSSCLLHYGRCVQRHLTHSNSHQNPACHQNLQSNAEGYFLCMVPPCLNAVG